MIKDTVVTQDTAVVTRDKCIQIINDSGININTVKIPNYKITLIIIIYEN